MSVTTLIAALVLMAVVGVLLAIGFLITGKVKIKRGTCGMIPKRKDNKDEPDKDSSCSICGSKKPCDKEK